MKLIRSLPLIVSASLWLSSCSKGSESKTITVKNKGAVTEDGNGPNGKLSLASVDGASDVIKAYLQSADLEWALTDASLMMSKPDGSSLIYNRANAEWGTVETSSEAAAYGSLYTYHDGSFSGLKPGVLSFRSGTTKVLSFDTTKAMPDGSPIIGVNPGFFAASLIDGIMVVRSINGVASALKVKNSPATLLEVGSCTSGCVLWGYDGEALFTFGTNDVWTKHSIPFALPANKKVSRLTMSLALDDKAALTISNAALITDDGLLYVSSKTVAAGEITFEQVKKLTTTYCISCHSGDAFELEAGLKARKSELIRRLELAADHAQVMPPKTAPKPISLTDKKTIVSWLKLQTQGVDTAPVITTPGTTPENATIPITGVLATQAEKYCFSCHPVAKFKAFWINEKGNITNRVNSGNMPAGKTMTAADKEALLSALNALN